MVTLKQLRERVAVTDPAKELEDCARHLREVSAEIAAGASPLAAWQQQYRLSPGPGICWQQQVARQLENQYSLLPAGMVSGIKAALQLIEHYGIEAVSVHDLLAENLESQAGMMTQRSSLIAGPQASARLLAWLPVAAIAAGELAGLGVVRILFATVIGWICLLLSAGLIAFGRWWSGALVREAERAGQNTGPLPAQLVAVLLAELVSSGQSPVAGLDALGQFGADRNLSRIAAQMRSRMEVPPAQLFGAEVGPLLEALRKVFESGADPQALLTHAGEVSRRAARQQIVVAAGRLSSLIVLPLALCFLPAFMLAGVVPAVLSLVGGFG
ncbi:type II secretion system F family protein [Boudabousia marimammalium]|uniref:Type II secretion system protein GspF domain-containing protein n=1 Tax=Boudabousia marimammalium TaxID=156892 RepID=A0A1Q5PSW8_9ACTO|nr:type II secretion system F family protein [Boudabousia marimammalium]OKL50638.1 hypothetical protein BM477_01415 [Boudabousia marimammalium]